MRPGARARCKRCGRGGCRFGCGVRGGGGGFLVWGDRWGGIIVVGVGFVGDIFRIDWAPVGLLGQCCSGEIGLP